MIPDFKKEGWKQVSRTEASFLAMKYLGKEGFDAWVAEPKEDDIDFHDTTPLHPVRNSYWIKMKK